MRHTLFEVLGLKSKSCKVWDRHFAIGLSCFAFAPSAAAFWAVALCLLQFADLEAGPGSLEWGSWGLVYVAGSWHFDPVDLVLFACHDVHHGCHHVVPRGLSLHQTRAAVPLRILGVTRMFA